MAARETEEIIKLINSNSQDIVDNISRESIDVYNFIKSQFDENNIIENYLFQFIYRSFYRIDNAGLTKEFKTMSESELLSNNWNFVKFLKKGLKN